MNKCGAMFAYNGRIAQVCLSDAMTRNGRGFSGWGNAFGAVAPIPRTPKAIDNTCFILLHEYTHQLTDALLKTSIYMDDVSHELSENVVMRFDYDWLEKIDEPLLNRYLAWIADKSSKRDKAVLLKESFVRIFPVPEILEQQMALLVEKVFQQKS